MLGFQLDIKKKYELWSLVGPESVRFSLLEFENLTGLNCEYIEDLERPHSVVKKELTSFGRCWEFMSSRAYTRLADLAIFTGYIEGRKYSTLHGSPCPGVHSSSELGATFGNPLPNNPPPPILAYKGRKGRYSLKRLSSVRVINFVQKDTGEMFPKWEFDVEDTLAENIIKLMFVKKPWKWTMDCWEVPGTWVNTKLGGCESSEEKGTIPSFCQSNKVLGTDIDDIYAPVNFADSHWIAMWISIPKRHIVVFDSICSSISLEELDVVMEPFLYMVPYLLVECASSDELHAQYSLETFTYERPTNIPPARAGDCGVYTLKYIECHALGIEFSKKDFAKPNGKSMRDKMAVDIFQELPDAHEFENKDIDDILGTYDG
ncbi:hypothetical protein Bca52824_086774 [Brassica carinata]|uniref:Ubiquitin-like protease family profile domain-containing protein n=1 Tax=Brassica carinata TaxID=52824 RepID=A0A8X7TP80_BRACI|nr:hypothetical protein Bca52824_086774 [Brassica carinata]